MSSQMNKPPGFYFPATEVTAYQTAYIRYKYRTRNSPTYQVNLAAAERIALRQGLGRVWRASYYNAEQYMSEILNRKLEQLSKRINNNE